jgi:hypothetical protein
MSRDRYWGYVSDEDLARIEGHGPPRANIWALNNRVQAESRELDYGETKTLYKLTTAHATVWPEPLITLTCMRRDSNDVVDISSSDNRETFLRGKLIFGAGSASDTVEFDWQNGTMITVPVGGVDLMCSYLDLGRPANESVKQIVSVVVSTAIRPPSAGVTPFVRFTTVPATLDVGSSLNVPVPRRAIAMSLLLSDETVYGNMVVDRLVGRTSNCRFVPNDDREALLPNGCNRVRIQNNGANLVEATIVFTLAI